MSEATLAGRLGSEWRSKASLSLALPAFFCLGYFSIQRFPLFPVRSFQPSWLDRAIEFDPRWTLVYQSLYLLTALPWLATSAEELRRYLRGFLVLCCCAFAVFVAMPVAVVRPEADAHRLYALLLRYDGPLNSFPSLHIALAAYMSLFGARLLGNRAWIISALFAWVAAIAYATLATKQHLAVDLPPGLILAWLAHRYAWRNGKENLMSSTRLVSAALALACLAPRAARAGEEEERQALRQLKTLYEQAVNEDKLDLLAPHLALDFTGVMLTSEPVTGLEGMKAYWKKMKDMMGSAGRYHVDVTYEPAQFFGDVAVAHGSTNDVVTLPGKEFRFTGHWTAVCVKKDGAWKIVRIHASMDPLTNPFVSSWLQAGRYGYAGGGLAGGVVLGGLLGAAVARRKRG